MKQNMKIERGTILWFYEKKGFGFIKPDNQLIDGNVFFHISQLEMSGIDPALVIKDQLVDFQTIEKDGRVMATNIAIAEK